MDVGRWFRKGREGGVPERKMVASSCYYDLVVLENLEIVTREDSNIMVVIKLSQ